RAPGSAAMSRHVTARTATAPLTVRIGRGFLAGLRFAPLFCGLSAFLLVVTGRLGQVTWTEILLIGALLASLIGTVARRFRRTGLGLPTTFRDDVELGAQLIGAGFV